MSYSDTKYNKITISMGIYSNGIIFGIRIYTFNDDKNITLYEEIYDEPMSYHQMKEAHLFYTLLNENTNIFFQIYTECTSTLSYKLDNYMAWNKISLDSFIEKFSK